MISRKLIMPIVIISILLIISCSVAKPMQAEPISQHILEPNDKFEILWHVSDISMSYNYRRPNMVGVPGKIVILGSKSRDAQTGTLIGLDSLSGDIIWTAPGASLGEIISYGENLYRGSMVSPRYTPMILKTVKYFGILCCRGRIVRLISILLGTKYLFIQTILNSLF